MNLVSNKQKIRDNTHTSRLWANLSCVWLGGEGPTGKFLHKDYLINLNENLYRNSGKTFASTNNPNFEDLNNNFPTPTPSNNQYTAAWIGGMSGNDNSAPQIDKPASTNNSSLKEVDMYNHPRHHQQQQNHRHHPIMFPFPSVSSYLDGSTALNNSTAMSSHNIDPSNSIFTPVIPSRAYHTRGGGSSSDIYNPVTPYNNKPFVNPYLNYMVPFDGGATPFTLNYSNDYVVGGGRYGGRPTPALPYLPFINEPPPSRYSPPMHPPTKFEDPTTSENTNTCEGGEFLFLRAINKNYIDCF